MARKEAAEKHAAELQELRKEGDKAYSVDKAAVEQVAI